MRYADDFQLLCRTREEAEAALQWVTEVLAPAGLDQRLNKQYWGSSPWGVVSGRRLRVGLHFVLLSGFQAVLSSVYRE